MELFKFQVMFFVILVICVDAKYIVTNFSVPDYFDEDSFLFVYVIIAF